MAEENKHHLLKVLGIILATFVGAFLAFYLAVDITLSRLFSPEYNMRKMEKIIQKQERNFRKFDDKLFEHPFEPKMEPMLVNLVKESNEYKIIVDLKPLDGNEKNVNMNIDDNIATISGEMDKNDKHSEKMIKFTQSFYLDEAVNSEKITKEKHGNKYIITIPFKN